MNEEIEQNDKLFIIEGITNKEIGKKIKAFSKVFLKIEIIFLFLSAFILLTRFLQLSDYMEGEEALLILLYATFVYFLAFIIIYFGFLITSGFGALVEDINAIKNANVKTTTKKIKDNE